MTIKTAIPLMIAFTVVIVLLLLYFLFPAGQYHFPRCIFYSFTGFNCPGCGSQRAASSLLHGRLLQAMDYNLLYVLLLPFVLQAAIAWAWNSWKPNNTWPSLLHSKVFVRILFYLVILFWVVRNIPVLPFSWLKA